MRREFILNLFIVICANLLVKPIYIFGIDRTVQNTVGPEEYGVYFALFNFALLFQIVTDLGLQNFNNRSISQSGVLIHSYFPAVLLIKTALALAFLVLIYLGALVLGYDGSQLELLLWVALNTILVSLILYLRTNISGSGQYRWDSLLSILDKSLMILIIGYLLYTAPNFRIVQFIYGQTVALVISTVIIGIISYRVARPLSWPTSLHLPKDILRQSLPYALVVLLMGLYTRIDAVMLERLLDDGGYQAGVYASGYRLLDAANMLGFLTAGLLLPMFSRMLAQQENIFPLYSLSIRGAWLLALYTTVTCFVFRYEIVDLLYDDANLYWGDVLGCLMLSFIFVMIGYVTGPLLNATGSIHRLNWIFLISIFINVLLNWFLIQEYKAYGAAGATMVTQGIVVIAQLVYLRRTMDFSLSRYPLIPMISIGLLVAFSIIGLKFICQSGTQSIIGVVMIGALVLSYLIFFARKEIASERITLSND